MRYCTKIHNTQNESFKDTDGWDTVQKFTIYTHSRSDYNHIGKEFVASESHNR